MTLGRPTIHDVAKQANVSIAAVSMAINGTGRLSTATRERILSVAQQLDYLPNARGSSLRKGSSRLIGLVIAEFAASENFNPFANFWMRLIATASQEANANGYAVVIIPPDQLNLLHEIPLDAIAITDPDASQVALQVALKLGIPVVCSRVGLDHEQLIEVGEDYEAMVIETLDFLQLHGCKKPLVITRPLEFHSAVQTDAAFQQLCLARELKYVAIQISSFDTPLTDLLSEADLNSIDGVFSYVGSYPAVENLLAQVETARQEPIPFVYYDTGQLPTTLTRPTARLIANPELTAQIGMQQVVLALSGEGTQSRQSVLKLELETL